MRAATNRRKNHRKHHTEPPGISLNMEDIDTIPKAMDEEQEFNDFGTTTYTEKTRAVIKVQDGCNNFCSYCIIPYARGRVRSRKPESVIKEIEEIVNTGIKEVVITK